MKPSPALIVFVFFSLAGCIAVLTLRSQVPLPDLPLSDKVEHAISFAALIFPVAFWRPNLLWPALLFSVMFGGMIELIQPFVGRSGDLYDWFADIIGIGIGISTAGALRHPRRIPRS